MRRQTGPAYDDDIHPPQLPLAKTETLAYNTLDPIARHGGPGGLTGNSHPQTGIAQPIGTRKHRKPAISALIGPFKDTAKIGFVAKPGAPLKAPVHNGLTALT